MLIEQVFESSFMQPSFEFDSALAECLSGCSVGAAGFFDVNFFSTDLFKQHEIILPESLSNAAAKRQAEYLAGRILARNIFGYFECSNEQVLIGGGRQPLWPKGITGSISHTDNVVLSIIGTVEQLELIGCDIEPLVDLELLEEIKSTILVYEEIELLESLEFTKQEVFTLIFSAKESLYKALYPKVGVFFDFQAARVNHIDKQNRTISLVLTDGLKGVFFRGEEFTVKFTFVNEHALTVLQLNKSRVKRLF